MKKVFSLIFAIACSTTFAQSQWQGTTTVQYFNGGNVGIGTTSPRSLLEIKSTGDNNTVQTGLIIQQSNPGVPNNTAGVSMDFGIGNNTSNNNIEGRITLKETWYAQRPKLFFSLWDINNSMQDRMVIDTYGNVGIGTISPTKKMEILDLGNNASISSVLRLGQINTGNSQNGTGSAIEFASGDNSNAPQTLGTITVENTYFDTKSRMIFATKNASTGITNQVVIDDGGNVGIGTLSPNSLKLAVEGKIGAREVNVTSATTWPDYVFNKSYALPSLEQVKSYIDQNKHLPEIPSAAEIEKNGQNLGEMNMLLLKKVEELTLYVIELKKENDSLKGQSKDIEELKQEMKLIKSQLK